MFLSIDARQRIVKEKRSKMEDRRLRMAIMFVKIAGL
jgi:hypothetical protein